MANGRCGVGGGGGLSVGDITPKDKSADANFLVCDGSQVSAATYPQLTALLVKKADAQFVGKFVGGKASFFNNSAKKGNTIVLSLEGYSPLYSEDDGETWADANYTQTTVTANSTSFFGAKKEGNVYKSVDGSSWTSVYSPSTFGTKLNGKIVANDNAVTAFTATSTYTSTDGGTSFVETSYNPSMDAWAACNANGVMWYIGSDNVLYRSTDGTNWTGMDGGFSFTSSVKMVFEGGKVLFFEGTQIREWSNTQGSTIVHTAPYSVTGLVFANGYFYVSAGGRFYKSADLNSFEQVYFDGLSSMAKLYVSANDGKAIGYNYVNSASTLGKYNFEPVYNLPSLLGEYISTPYIKAK
jgi:hypothetical protein